MASKDSEECEDFTIDAQCDVNTNVRSYALSNLLNEKGDELRYRLFGGGGCIRVSLTVVITRYAGVIHK